MDTRTGRIYEALNNETLHEMAKRVGVNEEDLVPLERMPDKICKLCKGSGSRLKKQRFKPCKCTTNPTERPR